MTMQSQSFTISEELDGRRVDAALASLLGVSRTFAAEITEAGGVFVDGRMVSKSDKVRAGSRLDAAWTPKQEPTVIPVQVPELGIIYDDDHSQKVSYKSK